MKKIKTKMMFGIALIFIVSYLILLFNFGANQKISEQSKSLLEDNYTSVKYCFDMLRIIDEIHSAYNEVLINKTKVDTCNIKKIAINSNKLFSEFDSLLTLQMNNITEKGEQYLSQSLKTSYNKIKTLANDSIKNFNYEVYKLLYTNAKQNILDIHDLNSVLLEQKNKDIKHSAVSTMNTQKNVGIIGLTILGILIVFIPWILIRPIDKLTYRMIEFYKQNFNQTIEIKANHEIEKLEEMFKKIVLEFNKKKEQ